MAKTPPKQEYTAVSDSKVTTSTAVVASSGDVVAPSTTAEEDRHTASQRRVNIIWEITQAVIACAVTGATLWVAASLALSGDTHSAAFLLLSNAFFLVIGFYFGRTNHQRVGGVDLGR